MKRKKPTVEEIVELRWEMDSVYSRLHAQQREDDQFYNLLYDVAVSTTPDNFETVRPPTATTIIDMTADHASGNFPRLHVPRRKESAKAQEQTTVMEKAAQGFWYRTIANSSTNILRAWAQSGALRGAICGSLSYDGDMLADLPVPSEHGGMESAEYKELREEAEALRQSSWPFRLDYIDPMEVYPDPTTDGREFVIHAFKRKIYDVLRVWPGWDRMVPGDQEPRKMTDEIEFISYSDPEYRAYIVAGVIPHSRGYPLSKIGNGVQKHGYGFNPYFYIAGGFGSPFGSPEHRFRGMLTNVRDLLKLEARRMTHLDALIAQQAFPWLIAQRGVDPDMQLGGVTYVPQGTRVQDAITEMRPVVPIQEIVLELDTARSAIQRATIPDALGGTRPRGVDSGYHESLLVGTGRARIRALSNGLERAVEWASSGFYKLVEHKVKGPVSVWGKGMDTEQEFVTIKPEDIKGHYEVYASLVPSLPQDDSVNIANGLKLYEHGAIPIRDILETYAGRENAEELLNERLGEDVLKSPPMMQQLIAEAMKVTNVTGGPIAVPGFASGQIGLGMPSAPVGDTVNAASNPASMQGITNIPTPPAAPGSLQESNSIIGRTTMGGAPTSAGPIQGIQRGRP